MYVPDFYEHYCPAKIVAGQRALSNLPFEMGRFGPMKAMVVMDRAVHE
ncbi:alcohol dehydrogenase, partial [bacterium]|nr:alcohol dehydrogenase [bacterium]